MKRLPYEKAVMLRPPGCCYCDLDDRHCYEAGHWEAQLHRRFAQREAGPLATFVALALFIGCVAVWAVVLK